MAGGGKVSEERIAEALIKKVIEEELKDIPLQDGMPLTLDAVQVQNEQEIELVEKLFAMVRKAGEKVKDDEPIQVEKNGIAKIFKQGRIEVANETFQEVFKKMFKKDISLDKILKFLFVVGEMIRGIVMDLHQSWLDLHQSWLALRHSWMAQCQKWMDQRRPYMDLRESWMDLTSPWMDLRQSVKQIQNWTVDFFRNYLLGWILEQGGWSRCSVQS